jgi:hypothetical protein
MAIKNNKKYTYETYTLDLFILPDKLIFDGTKDLYGRI